MSSSTLPEPTSREWKDMASKQADEMDFTNAPCSKKRFKVSAVGRRLLFPGHAIHVCTFGEGGP